MGEGVSTMGSEALSREKETELTCSPSHLVMMSHEALPKC